MNRKKIKFDYWKLDYFKLKLSQILQNFQSVPAPSTSIINVNVEAPEKSAAQKAAEAAAAADKVYEFAANFF